MTNSQAGASTAGSAAVNSGGGLRWLALSVAVLALDQLSKLWIVRNFEYGESVELLPVLNITLRYNPGAAFSFLADASGWQRWFFVILALGVSIGIGIWLKRLNARAQPWLAASLSLILAGALGNVIDRLRLGHVVDFIHAHWGDADFPAFNVADSSITIGAILMLIDVFLEERRRKAR